MLGSLISAGASLLGGLFNRKAEKSALADTKAARAEDIALQKEFAQSGLQWRAEDARKAGIHPLYAVGANVPTFTPSGTVFGADRSMGDALSSMGQDVGSAVSRATSKGGRMQVALDALHLERAGLENDLLRSQIRRLSLDSPAFPGSETVMPGQGNARVVHLPDSAMKVGSGDPAQVFEQEYGEAADAVGGARLFRDLMELRGRQTAKEFREWKSRWLSGNRGVREPFGGSGP